MKDEVYQESDNDLLRIEKRPGKMSSRSTKVLIWSFKKARSQVFPTVYKEFGLKKISSSEGLTKNIARLNG